MTKSAKEVNEEFGTTIFYDGQCLMCNAFVRFLAKRKLPDSMRFATQTSSHYAQLLERFPDLAGIDSVVVLQQYSDGRQLPLVKAKAVTTVLNQLGGLYKGVGWLRAIAPLPADIVYDFIAANRKKAEPDNCPIPPANIRTRLLA